MKTTTVKNRSVIKKKPAVADAIAQYASTQSAEHTLICQGLRREIEAVLPKATSKIWHAMPVWFVGENPVVGYKATAKHVNLLFWNGQSFGEPALQAAGKFKAAQIQFTDESQIDVKALRRWLKKAGTDIWDFKAIRKRK
jgi:uncharacterized protein YdhG (YjbR/CyaY superfamily)